MSVGCDSKIEEVDDIGDVAEGDVEEGGAVRKVVEGEIDGVVFSEEYFGCIACSSKVKIVDDLIAECSKCGMTMKQAKCESYMMAKVSVGGSDGKLHNLTLFNTVLEKITDGVSGTDLKRKLLCAPPMRFVIDKGDIVYSAQKL